MIDRITTHGGTDDRAVSPVIGVILMVAITVILAAVIGTFVLDFGSDVRKTAPRASLAISDANDDYDGSNDAFTIEHEGGDDLAAREFEIRIRYATNNTAVSTWDDGSWSTPTAGGGRIADTLNGETALTTDDIFSTGDRLAIQGASNAMTDGTQFEISVLDKGSGEVIASGTVTLR